MASVFVGLGEDSFLAHLCYVAPLHIWDVVEHKVVARGAAVDGYYLVVHGLGFLGLASAASRLRLCVRVCMGYSLARTHGQALCASLALALSVYR